MKLLVLVLYSQQPVYQVMKTLLSKYYFNHPLVNQGFIKVVFYSYSSNETIADTEVTFPGEESLIPGILNKTILAFQKMFPVDQKKYDYCLRSNISTVVNLSELYLRLSLLDPKIDYGGSYVHTINKLNKSVGVDQESFIGKKFVSGTSILLSFDAMKLLLNNLDGLRTKYGDNVIDDVMIGLWMDEMGIKNATELPSKVNVDSICEGVLFYRNKRIVSNRANDIMAISRLCSVLIADKSK